MAVAYAILKGELEKSGVCERCGREVNTIAHHHKGYAKANWLIVQWLCQKCHGAVHHPGPRKNRFTLTLDPLVFEALREMSFQRRKPRNFLIESALRKYIGGKLNELPRV